MAAKRTAAGYNATLVRRGRTSLGTKERPFQPPIIFFSAFQEFETFCLPTCRSSYATSTSHKNYEGAFPVVGVTKITKTTGCLNGTNAYQF